MIKMPKLHKRLAELSRNKKLSTKKVSAELDRLDAEISRETDGERNNYLCAAYQALQWARNPKGFAAPSVA